MLMDGEYAALPTETMSHAAFKSLPEYSCSVPTGVFVGKVWKCNLSAFRPRRQSEPQWVIREYVANGPDRCRIENRRPVIAQEHAND